MKLKPILIPALILALVSAQALAGTAEDVLAGSLDEYRNIAKRGQWHNPWVPTANAGSTDALSADQMITRIVASHTRAMLDRGGWENPYLSNSQYASGNPLLAAQVGSGVTLAGSSARSLPAAAVIAMSSR